MDTSTLIQAKKQARNLLNKLLKSEGLDPAQKKQLTTVSRSLHYQIKDLSREGESTMKKLHISKIDADTIEYGDISTESKFDFTRVTIKDEYDLQLLLNLVLMFDRVVIGKQETDASTFYGGAALAFIQRPAHYADYITAPYK